MGRLAEGNHRSVGVKTDGRGSLLGLLSPPFAFLMASRHKVTYQLVDEA